MSLSFISDENLKKHIAETIKSYGENLQPYDIKKFNANMLGFKTYLGFEK